MNRKIVTKLLATFLAFTLSFANVAILGIYTSETYAASDKLEEQEKNISKTAIEFDAYFQENGQNVHSRTIDVEEEAKLYLNVKVQEGYLTNASIKIEDANFKVQDSEEKAEKIQSISSEENKIVLNQIDKGETAILEVPIKLDAGSSFDVKNLSKKAKVTLEGEYINNKGKEISVMAHGMGIPSMGIYSYELFHIYDVDTIIRIGSCGAISKELKLNDLILAEKSYTEGNYAYNFDNKESHIEESNEEINKIIENTAKEENIEYIKGNILCNECFDVYVPDKEAIVKRAPNTIELIATEMETFTVVDVPEDSKGLTAEERQNSLNTMIKLGLEVAIKI